MAPKFVRTREFQMSLIFVDNISYKYFLIFYLFMQLLVRYVFVNTVENA